MDRHRSPVQARPAPLHRDHQLGTNLAWLRRDIAATLGDADAASECNDERKRGSVSEQSHVTALRMHEANLIRPRFI
jgi:hypothetical protein